MYGAPGLRSLSGSSWSQARGSWDDIQVDETPAGGRLLGLQDHEVVRRDSLRAVLDRYSALDSSR